MHVHDGCVARAPLDEIDDGRIVDDRIGVGHAHQRRDAAGRRRLARRLQRLAVLGARLADEGAHVDEARRQDVAAAVDALRSARPAGSGRAPDDIGDDTVLDEHVATLLPPAARIDEAGVGENEGAGVDHAAPSIGALGMSSRRVEHELAVAARRLDHVVGTLRRPADAQACIVVMGEAPRDGMKDLVEDRVADPFRAGMLDQRQREPFAEDRQMAGAKDLERHVGHGVDIALDQERIVIGAGAVRPGDEDHEGLGAAHWFGRCLASASSTAMRTATPISTCSRMSDCAPSATSESISTPRFIGPGCMTSASGLA